MYITITPQKLGSTFSQSVVDYVEYLEKENQNLEIEEMEHFFNQNGEKITAQEVVRDIDANTSKLKKVEPKFYAITVSPSQYELRRLQNHSLDLKTYTREIMKDYAESFNREINGKAISVNDIKYYAKIENQRTFKGTDVQVRENQPYATKILKCKDEIQKIKCGEISGDISKLEKKIARLEKEAPHQLNGQRITQGMLKAGNQSHIHIIVSRKDMSNSFSLSPGSKYKSSEVEFNGKLVKRGFDRDAFFSRAEQSFDRLFKDERNFVETYEARKKFIKDPKIYFSVLLGLPANEKAMAFKMLRERGVPMIPAIPVNKAQLALKVFNKLKRGIDTAISSGSIGV